MKLTQRRNTNKHKETLWWYCRDAQAEVAWGCPRPLFPGSPPGSSHLPVWDASQESPARLNLLLWDGREQLPYVTRLPDGNMTINLPHKKLTLPSWLRGSRPLTTIHTLHACLPHSTISHVRKDSLHSLGPIVPHLAAAQRQHSVYHGRERIRDPLS